MIVAALLLAAALQQQSDRRIAVTFDDLPQSRSGAPVAVQESVTTALVGAITRQAVPAIGFVNEGKLRDSAGTLDPRRVALLTRWLDAGLELGNHSSSHPDLHATPLTRYEADILAGEQVLRSLLAARGTTPQWFRHPYLHTGRSVAVRDSLLAFLTAHGYRVAPVTVDNGDYLFARAYDLAADPLTRARIAETYLAYMDSVVVFYEGQSRAIIGREIPQVLLLHASALNAATFDRLAAQLRARGYAFVPIAEAVADSAYRSPDTYAGPAGISWLQRWAISRDLPRAIFRGEPEVPDWITSFSP